MSIFLINIFFILIRHRHIGVFVILFGNKLSLNIPQGDWLESGNMTKQFIEAASDGRCNRKELKKGIKSLQKATKKDYGVKLSADLLEGDKLCLTLQSQKVGVVRETLKDFWGNPLEAPYSFKTSTCFKDSISLELAANRINEAFSGLIKSYKQAADVKHLEGQSISFAAKLLKRLGKQF